MLLRSSFVSFVLVLVVVLAAPFALSGCDSEKGGVRFDTWGEAFIEEGIPASEFADGWSLKYERFVLVFSDVSVRATRGGASLVRMNAPKVFDLVKPGVKTLAAFENLPSGPFPHASFQIGPPSATAELGEGATEEDRKLLVDRGASLYVAGSAAKGGTTKTFRWPFSAPTRFDECRGEKDGKEIEGVLVKNGSTDAVELTIHGDHLFYNDLQAEGAVLRFDPLAKADDDGNRDGDVALEELRNVRLSSLPPELGYGTGSASGVDTLEDFVLALARTVGHFRGEGECVSKPALVRSLTGPGSSVRKRVGPEE